MAKVPWEVLGDAYWEEANPDKWCIYNVAWESGKNVGDTGWNAYHPQVFGGTEHPYEGFATHAEATAYVRSQIDRLRPTD